MDNLKPEQKAEVVLWDWLRNYGDVYFNKKNVVNCDIFRVEGEIKEIPDFVLRVIIFNKQEYIAIEIKDGDRSSNVRDGNKIFSKYLLNYYNKKTKYFIEDKEIKISRFFIATQYSVDGHLFGTGDDIVSNDCAIENNWNGRIVPQYEYSRTKDYGRNLLHDYSMWRKENKIKQCYSLGWIISSKDKKPLLQGISFNEKLNRWSQSLIEL